MARGEDFGPTNPQMWVFTLGEPRAEFMAKMWRMVEGDLMSWVVVPIHNRSIQTLRMPVTGGRVIP